MKLLFVLLGILVLVFGLVAAQDDNADACDYTTLGERLVEVGESLADSDDPAAALTALQTEIATFRVGCDGMTFTSEEYGLSKVTDPIEFTDGIYRIIIESTETFSADLLEMDGDCGLTYYAVIGDEGQHEIANEMEGCVGVFTFDGRTDWTLAFERLGDRHEKAHHQDEILSAVWSDAALCGMSPS